MHRMSRAVRAITGIALASALGGPAAAEEKSTKPRIAVIEFRSPAGGASPAPLEILGFDWGDADSAGNKKAAASAPISHDLRTNVIARTAPPPGETGDPDRPIVAGTVPNATGNPVGAAQTLTVGGARTETASGQATGKRQPMPVLSGVEGPIRMRPADDQPLTKGSVRVRVASPWAACRVGARYPSLRLAEGARAYTLEDVTVTSCGGDADDRPTEEIAFAYGKVTVRGWDPQKKEE